MTRWYCRPHVSSESQSPAHINNSKTTATPPPIQTPFGIPLFLVFLANDLTDETLAVVTGPVDSRKSKGADSTIGDTSGIGCGLAEELRVQAS